MNRREVIACGVAAPLLGWAGVGLSATPSLAAARAALAAGSAEFARLVPPGAALAYVAGGSSAPPMTLGREDLLRRDRVTASTIFQIASLTKPFTAIIMLTLAEEGRLAVDNRARRWLDWLPEAYQGVSIRHLLTHVSGVPRDLRRANVDEFDLDEFRRRFLAAAPSFASGERWEYANTGYTLLALIAERASGKPFGQLLAERIFAPLDMRSTRYRAPLHAASGRASGYDWLEEAWRPAALAYSGWGNSGIETNIIDLVRFAEGLHRRRLLRPASYGLMLTPARLGSGQPVEFPFRDVPTGYGFGWFLGRQCGSRIASHGGAVAGFSSMLSWLPDRNVSILALANGKSGPDRIGIAEKIAGAALAPALGCGA